MSWSSNGSPHESPLFTRSAVGAVRPPHWGPAVASETRERETRDAYGSFYHDHQQRLSQPHQFVNRRVPTNGHASPSSSLSGEELLDTGDADHVNPAVTGALAGGNKNSRYLREMDRRAILERLANGEKQAALAKEFQVSRAAICNLNKHRDEVMSRADENPFAKHPKKRKVRMASAKPANDASTATVPTVEDQSMPSKAEDGPEVEPLVIKAVHVVQSRAVQLLMTTLRSHTTPRAEFRRCSDRVLRLVLEDALALVPTTPVDVYLNDQVKVEGVGRQHALCGISLEQRHCPVMDMFHVIEPDQPTGYVRCTNGDVTLLDAHLPASLASHNVFLFDLVAASGETVCATLEQLLARGAVESQLYVVALFVASDVVAAVQCTFPRVHIVTAQIDASLNAGQKSRRRSDTGRLDDMLTRFAEVYNGRF
jgi:uracil phosphoribosyltransferase